LERILLHVAHVIGDDLRLSGRQRKRIRLCPTIYRASGQVFFLTICTENRRPWFSLHPSLAADAAAEIDASARAGGTKLHAWCVMPDHVHLLVEGGDVIDLVRAFKGRTSAIARHLEPRYRLWQRGFHDHALRADEQVVNAARYVLFNPVRARIVENPGDYRWMGSVTWPDWRGCWPGMGREGVNPSPTNDRPERRGGVDPRLNDA
jgi:REP element-mobilizing transposase RayT